ncbi:MAG: PH domain-containing protein [Lachnospiraceae bacterium]|nr:PH domain-containing protein [Lachnospiraceae bacterium]MDY3818972.1 PH domain-containing protein [Lachnospiraceae bacterium]
MSEKMNTTDDNDKKFVERKRILFLGLPWTFTKYIINEEFLTVDTGLFRTTEEDCYMYRIQDVKQTTTLMERMVGVSTLTCYTGDVTTPEIVLKHIRHGKDIKTFILHASEASRIKRRTLSTIDIGAHGMDDVDDIM